MEYYIQTITEHDVVEFATIHVLSWQAAYKNIVPDEYLDNLSVKVRAERFRQPRTPDTSRTNI